MALDGWITLNILDVSPVITAHTFGSVSHCSRMLLLLLLIQQPRNQIFEDGPHPQIFCNVCSRPLAVYVQLIYDYSDS